jgi:DNA-binding response OmpR family regulator
VPTAPAWRKTREFRLTTRESALLEYFLRNAGLVLTRPMILDHVWGLGFETESNIIDVYVGYLREKIDGPEEQPLLHTVRGFGYLLTAGNPPTLPQAVSAQQRAA